MNVVREIDRINRRQLEYSEDASWHDDYKDSAYIFVGGIPYELTEGDIICVFSQFGEILDINLVRDRETGKSKGFCFLKYDDQRSTVLAVDNFNGATLLGRTLRVDHSRDYRQMSKKQKKKYGEEESQESSEEELDEDGKRRIKGFNVAPKGWLDDPVEIDTTSEDEFVAAGIDPEDPMRDYLLEKRREEKKGKNSRKHRRQIKEEEDDEEKHRHRHRSRHRSSQKGGERRHRHQYRNEERLRPRDRDEETSGERKRQHQRDRHRSSDRDDSRNDLNLPRNQSRLDGDDTPDYSKNKV